MISDGPRSWLHIDRNAAKPRAEDIASSHRTLGFRPVTIEAPATAKLIRAFDNVLTHGGARLATFAVDYADGTAHWFLSRNRFEEYGFVEQLLRSDAFAESLPDFVPVDPSDEDFSESSPLLLDEELAGALVWGGAYGRFDGPQAEAKRLGIEVSEELIGGRYEEFRVDRSFVAWSDWFGAVAWDKTWLITDKRQRRVTLICLTDEDGPR